MSSNLSPLVAYPVMKHQKSPENDPLELFHGRYLCRKGAMMLAGQTGIGKSSWSMQAILLFSLGREYCGLRPIRPIKSLLIQAENDDGDLAEMRDGVIKGLNLTQEEIAQVNKNVWICTCNDRNGELFLTAADSLLEAIKPDLWWLDPAHAYSGCDASSQKEVSIFLRMGLTPILNRHNCAMVLMHHTNKPKDHNMGEMMTGDFSYAGAGSAEWANWSRAIFSLQSTKWPGVYELRAAKRGGRLLWTDEEGNATLIKHLKHDTRPEVICWHVCEEPVKTKVIKRAKTEADLLVIFPNFGVITQEKLRVKAGTAGISKNTFYDLITILVDEGKVLKESVPRKSAKAQITYERAVPITDGMDLGGATI